jgi:hypothetical protein
MGWRQGVAIIAFAEAFSACVAVPLVELPQSSAVSPTREARLVGLSPPEVGVYKISVFKMFSGPTYHATANEIVIDIPGGEGPTETLGRIPVADASRYIHDSIANHLASRGFDVVPMPRPSKAPIPSRVISVRLIDPQFHVNKDVTGAMATQLECNVQDSSANSMFSKTYAASSPEDPGSPGVWATMKESFSRSMKFEPLPGTQPEELARNFAAAIDSAVVQMCDDPAFIAALAPSAVATQKLGT